MNTMMHVSFQIMFFSSYMPRSQIAGLYGNSIYSFLGNLPISLWASLVKKQRIRLQETPVQFLGREDLLEKG